MRILNDLINLFWWMVVIGAITAVIYVFTAYDEEINFLAYRVFG